MSIDFVLQFARRQDATATYWLHIYSTLIAEVSGKQGIEADQGGKKIFFIYVHRLTKLGGWPWAS